MLMILLLIPQEQDQDQEAEPLQTDRMARFETDRHAKGRLPTRSPTTRWIVR